MVIEGPSHHTCDESWVEIQSKRTIRVENEVEANKLVNNYRVRRLTPVISLCEFKVTDNSSLQLCVCVCVSLVLENGKAMWQNVHLRIGQRLWKSSILSSTSLNPTQVQVTVLGMNWHRPLYIFDFYRRCWRSCQRFIKKFLFLASGRLLTCGNVVYVFLFGWWVSLAYFLVAIFMFLTITGVSYGRSAKHHKNDDLCYSSGVFVIHFLSLSSGKLCWKLSCYFLWPFGKSIHEVHSVTRWNKEKAQWNL